MSEYSKSKDILNTIRMIKEEHEYKSSLPPVDTIPVLDKDNFVSIARELMTESLENKKKRTITEDKDSKKEEIREKTKNQFVIKKSTPQFGDVRTSQEESLRKTIGESIKLEDDALIYYPDIDDITMSGRIDSMNLAFQFRLNSASGDGCFIWSKALCLSEANVRTIGKIRDAFENWKDSLTQDGDLMEKLKKASKSQK